MELHGERVVLRTLVEGDVAALAELADDPEIVRWWNVVGEPYLREELELGRKFTITVEGERAGMIEFYEELEDDFRHAGMDLFVGAAFRGRGVGADAVRTMARYLIDERGHHRLIIDPTADNTAAIRCYERSASARSGSCASTGSTRKASSGTGCCLTCSLPS